MCQFVTFINKMCSVPVEVWSAAFGDMQVFRIYG